MPPCAPGAPSCPRRVVVPQLACPSAVVRGEPTTSSPSLPRRTRARDPPRRRRTSPSSAGLPAHGAARLIARDQLLALELDDEVAADRDPRLDIGVGLPQHVARARGRTRRSSCGVPAATRRTRAACARLLTGEGCAGSWRFASASVERVALFSSAEQPEHAPSDRTPRARASDEERASALHFHLRRRALRRSSRPPSRDGRGGFFGVAST